MPTLSGGGDELPRPWSDQRSPVGGARRADAGGAAGVDGDLHHRHGAADDRRRVRRLRELRLGGHGLHRRRRHRHAVARQALRSLRAPARVPDDDGPVHRRLVPVRDRPEHGPAHRRPGGPGLRRRCHPGAGVRHPRRHPPAAGAGPLHRLLHARLRRRRPARTAHRRVHHRPLDVAVDLLHQHPAGRLRHRGQLLRAAPAVPASQGPPRRPRRAAAVADHRDVDDRAGGGWWR